MNKLIDLLKANIVKDVGETIDSLSTSDDEKLAAKAKLSEIVLTRLSEIAAFQKEIIVGEASGNWLQRSWRPILMLAFGFVVIYAKFLAPAFNLPNTELEPSFWDLLQLGMGGYVVGRSLEKISETLTKNIDMPFLKKKDRN